MAARKRLVLLLLLLIVGMTTRSLRVTRTFSSPKELLSNWQRAAESVKSVQGSIHVWHYDPVWGDKEFEGQFWYTADQRGAYLLRPLPPQHPDDWEYYEWDSSQFKMVDHHRRETYILQFPLAERTRLAKSSRQRQVVHTGWWGIFVINLSPFALPSERLPMILPREGKFWADEFHWKPVPGLPTWLTADPIDADDTYKERIDLIIDPKSGLPLGVQVHEPGPSRTRKVYIVSKQQINAPTLSNIKPEFDETSPKWKIVRESILQTAKVQ